MWFRDQRRYLRKVMGACQVQFVKKTGGGDCGADAADEDNRFWHYVHHDVLLMFMWLHWGRGNNVPSHCSSLLDADVSFDTGIRLSNPQPLPLSSPSRTKRHSGASDDLLTEATRTVKSVHESMLTIMSPLSSRGSADPEVVAAEMKAKLTAAFTSRIRDLQAVADMKPDQADVINTKIDVIVSQLLAIE